ncbi:hypothetical protein D1B31_22110 [Neobacillus notoginsengisoli]|uniref:Uncharacterized protein n=1 Tax=Neobacillus notoginsengisoli TaxID=1578198 RepID=A0A417YFN3_9BACI|nr:hypothetical protein [Neobacillus notoginsengisoli]RHW31503.1 hypothetical protein D1B31_22110 [Neobacillus notoginsengisoli]
MASQRRRNKQKLKKEAQLKLEEKKATLSKELDDLELWLQSFIDENTQAEEAQAEEVREE